MPYEIKFLYTRNKTDVIKANRGEKKRIHRRKREERTGRKKRHPWQTGGCKKFRSHNKKKRIDTIRALKVDGFFFPSDPSDPNIAIDI